MATGDAREPPTGWRYRLRGSHRSVTRQLGSFRRVNNLPWYIKYAGGWFLLSASLIGWAVIFASLGDGDPEGGMEIAGRFIVSVLGLASNHVGIAAATLYCMVSIGLPILCIYLLCRKRAELARVGFAREMLRLLGEEVERVERCRLKLDLDRYDKNSRLALDPGRLFRGLWIFFDGVFMSSRASFPDGGMVDRFDFGVAFGAGEEKGHEDIYQAFRMRWLELTCVLAGQTRLALGCELLLERIMPVFVHSGSGSSDGDYSFELSDRERYVDELTIVVTPLAGQGISAEGIEKLSHTDVGGILKPRYVAAREGRVEAVYRTPLNRRFVSRHVRENGVDRKVDPYWVRSGARAVLEPELVRLAAQQVTSLALSQGG